MFEYTGSEDWSLVQQRSLEVKPGQIYALGGWVRVTGQGDTTLCVTLRDASEKVTDWVFAGQTTGARKAGDCCGLGSSCRPAARPCRRA